MSDTALKTIIAAFFLIAGMGAFLSMMALMGRPGSPGGTARGRRIHRLFGWLYAALLVPLAYLGSNFIKEMGDGLSIRAGLHFVLAATLIVLLLLKVLIVRFYKGFVKNAPALGMALFVLTLVIFLITAGFFIIQTAAAK